MLTVEELRAQVVKHFESAPVTEHHTFRFQLDQNGLEENEFRGMATVFNTRIDTFIPTMIRPGAFTDTLADKEQRARVKVLWQHFDPIGVPTMMRETELGLEVIGKVSDTQRGQDAITLMRDEVITELSVGIDAIEFGFEEIEGEMFRIVTKAKLWEFSLVTHGANADAKVISVNSKAMAEAFSRNDLGAVATVLAEAGLGKEWIKNVSQPKPAGMAAFMRLLDEDPGKITWEVNYKPNLPAGKTTNANSHSVNASPAASASITLAEPSEWTPEGFASEAHALIERLRESEDEISADTLKTLSDVHGALGALIKSEQGDGRAEHAARLAEINELELQAL